MLHFAVLDVLALEDAGVFDVWGFVYSSVEDTCAGGVARFAVGLAENVFRFDSWHVTSISYRTD